MDLIKILQENVTLEALYYLFTFLVFMDVITGVTKAWKQGRVKSRTLRDGLFGSVGELILLFIAIVIANIIPVAAALIFVLIIFMSLKELWSICENLIEIGVKLPGFLVKGLQVYTDKIDNLGNEEQLK